MRRGRTAPARTAKTRTVKSRTGKPSTAKTRTRRAAPLPGGGGGRILWVAWALVAGWLAVEAFSLPSAAALAALERTLPEEWALLRVRREAAVADGREWKQRHRPVGLEEVSPAVVSAVVASEDARFFAHDGLDLREVHAALRASVVDGKRLRGASTLTQQLAKNLYLSESRSLLRKLKELWIAHLLEQRLSKGRILELYLNLVEWGDGVFGVEAAARVHLGIPAADLSLAEAVALAAMLPNPRIIDPSHPAVLHRRALRVLERVAAERLASPTELEAARDELGAWLGPPDA